MPLQGGTTQSGRADRQDVRERQLGIILNTTPRNFLTLVARE